MIGHSLWWLVILIGLGLLIWMVFSTRRGGSPRTDKADSLEILKIRLAKGEISIEEYKALKSVL